jgi:iron complex transport system permease protein
MTNRKLFIVLIYLLPVPVVLGSLFVGPSHHVSISEMTRIFMSRIQGFQDATLGSIIWDIRMPRIILVFIVGSVLAMSGAALQAVFRNPLVDPFVLGLSSGAAFGASLAMAVSFFSVQVSAFLFGIVAVAASYAMARKNGKVSIVSLILAGIIVNGVFTALFTIVQFISDPFKLQTIVHWTMGDFHNANWNKVQSVVIPAVMGATVLVLFRWRLNVLSLGDEEARAVGARPEREKIIILLAATLASSAAVAVAGIISLYGLLVPHSVRMLAGVDNQRSIPLNLFLGGSFLVVIDDVSRTLAGFEIPIGVFTMLIGAPFFIFLMKKTAIGWEK